jgi:hypothetical protein
MLRTSCDVRVCPKAANPRGVPIGEAGGNEDGNYVCAIAT